MASAAATAPPASWIAWRSTATPRAISGSVVTRRTESRSAWGVACSRGRCRPREVLDLVGVGLLFRHLRDDDERNSVGQCFHDAAHSTVRDKRCRVGEHIELGHAGVDLHRLRHRSEAGGVDTVSDRHDDVHVGVREGFDARPVELGSTGELSAERDEEDCAPVLRGLPAALVRAVTQRRPCVGDGPGGDGVGVALEGPRKERHGLARSKEQFLQ